MRGRGNNGGKKNNKKSAELIVEVVDPFPTTIYFEEEECFKPENTKYEPVLSGIRDLLLKHLNKQEKENKEESEESEMEDEDLEQFAEDGLTKIRKDSIFKDELTDNEKDLISKRLEIQKQKFEKLQKKRENRILKKIRNVHPHLTDDEIKVGLEECENDDVRSILKKIILPI